MKSASVGIYIVFCRNFMNPILYGERSVLLKLDLVEKKI